MALHNSLECHSEEPKGDEESCLNECQARSFANAQDDTIVPGFWVMQSSPNKVVFFIARAGKWLLLLCLLILLPRSLFADEFPKFKSSRIENLAVEVAVIVDPEQVLPGKKFHLRLRVSIPEGWHIYSMRLEGENSQLATTIRFDENSFPIIGKWEESPPRMEMDDVLQKVVKSHGQFAEFDLLQRVPETVAPGDYPISGTMVYHACDNKVCTLPRELPFKTRIRVAGRG